MLVAPDQCLRVSCKVLARRKVVPNRLLLQLRVFKVRGIRVHPSQPPTDSQGARGNSRESTGIGHW